MVEDKEEDTDPLGTSTNIIRNPHGEHTAEVDLNKHHQNNGVSTGVDTNVDKSVGGSAETGVDKSVSESAETEVNTKLVLQNSFVLQAYLCLRYEVSLTPLYDINHTRNPLGPKMITFVLSACATSISFIHK